jgi:hypothetical protein
METGKELSKKARPGQTTIRGSMKPDVIVEPYGYQNECDYCDDGVPKIDGWHVIDDEVIGESVRVPCGKRP